MKSLHESNSAWGEQMDNFFFCSLINRGHETRKNKLKIMTAEMKCGDVHRVRHDETFCRYRILFPVKGNGRFTRGDST